MTGAELATQINRDISEKGFARVPIGIAREVFVGVKDPRDLLHELEDLARGYRWQVQYEAGPARRFFFCPVGRKLKVQEGK